MRRLLGRRSAFLHNCEQKGVFFAALKQFGGLITVLRKPPCHQIKSLVRWNANALLAPSLRTIGHHGLHLARCLVLFFSNVCRTLPHRSPFRFSMCSRLRSRGKTFAVTRHLSNLPRHRVRMSKRSRLKNHREHRLSRQTEAGPTMHEARAKDAEKHDDTESNQTGRAIDKVRINSAKLITGWANFRGGV